MSQWSPIWFVKIPQDSEWLFMSLYPGLILQHGLQLNVLM